MGKVKIEDRRKRRILFIDKKFQSRFIINFCSIVVIGGIVITGLLYLFTMRSNTVSFVNSRVVVQTTADFLLPLLIQTVGIVMILMGLVTAIVALLVSHKIAGPLYRVKKVLKMLGDGDFSGDFHIRSKDQLQDLARILNEMIIKLRAKLKELAKEDKARYFKL